MAKITSMGSCLPTDRTEHRHLKLAELVAFKSYALHSAVPLVQGVGQVQQNNDSLEKLAGLVAFLCSPLGSANGMRGWIIGVFRCMWPTILPTTNHSYPLIITGHDPSKPTHSPASYCWNNDISVWVAQAIIKSNTIWLDKGLGNPDQNVVVPTICCWWTCGFAWWFCMRCPSKKHHWGYEPIWVHFNTVSSQGWLQDDYFETLIKSQRKLR